ncbi:MAG: alpha/beta hydrolase [Chthoniobacteraceae bacterium]
MNFATRTSSGTPALRYAEGPAAGPTLLLLHGITRCWRDWEPLLPALTSEWRVIAPDHRGHGGSERAGSYLVMDYVSDAVRFVRDEVAAPLVVAGHSLGATVAAAVAAELPQFVRGVVLEDPPFHTMGNMINGTAWQAQFIGMRDVARRGGTVGELAAALAEIRVPVSGDFKRLGELRDLASLHWSAECLADLDPEVLTPVIEGRWLDGYDFTEVLSRVRCPALLLQADAGAGGALSATNADEAVAALSSCQRVHFPGVGHQLHRDRPEAVLRAFQEFAEHTKDKRSAPTVR